MLTSSMNSFRLSWTQGGSVWCLAETKNSVVAILIRPLGNWGVVLSEDRPPRLVVDSSVSEVTCRTVLPNKAPHPTLTDVRHCLPLDFAQERLCALVLDVSKAHRRSAMSGRRKQNTAGRDGSCNPQWHVGATSVCRVSKNSESGSDEMRDSACHRLRRKG